MKRTLSSRKCIRVRTVPYVRLLQTRPAELELVSVSENGIGGSRRSFHDYRPSILQDEYEQRSSPHTACAGDHLDVSDAPKADIDRIRIDVMRASEAHVSTRLTRRLTRVRP